MPNLPEVKVEMYTLGNEADGVTAITCGGSDGIEDQVASARLELTEIMSRIKCLTSVMRAILIEN